MFKMGSFNLLVFLPIFLSLHLYSSALETELIVGGSLTPHCQLKYQLGLKLRNALVCGGAIINENYAVTAAHCVLAENEGFTSQRVEIVAGTTDLKKPAFKTKISKIFLHSDYVPGNYKADIAVLKVNPPFVLNNQSCMAKVDLPRNASDAFLNQNVTLSGFGFTRPEDQKVFNEFDKLIPSTRLYQLSAKVKSNEQCQSLWDASLVSINVPKNLTIPMPRVLPEFSRLAHGLRSGNITILDSKTFYIPNLHYDGKGPDAYFWVGNGSEPDQYGMKIPNEVNETTRLSGYEGVDIKIVLPDGLTVYDIDYLGVWCVQYKHNFGYVRIPKDLEVPPAVGQTKIATYADNLQFGAIPRQTIEDTFICAEAFNATKYEPTGSCKKDEGGAFVTNNNVLAGIAILNPFTCNNYLAPAVGIRVASYLPFIQKALNDDEMCKVVSVKPYKTCVVS